MTSEAELKKREKQLYQNQWELLVDLQKVLLPLRLVTKIFDQKKKPTLALAIPSLLHLKKLYDELDGLKHQDAVVVKNSIAEGLDIRLVAAVNKAPHWMSVLFDPRTKDSLKGGQYYDETVFLGQREFEKVNPRLEEEAPGEPPGLMERVLQTNERRDPRTEYDRYLSAPPCCPKGEPAAISPRRTRLAPTFVDQK
mmetsp:Transcript_40581/g.56390  ORF Transcript_40581/g.56390 Transcript_40581/m.56390 type:complete len:196 (+) Transcript_40581:1009-1596(+)|eukprot:CAMPEP_0201504070 /NCGR_PEP_ID=MMETSP0151_2-20130828/84967_1 /ASSEMBLY_ACC=CAM_ASM_000257 /TAXON_ID=200890 /ORGANISM="Paramoeba atlantica, Strain 621/1 / CCAP 1560/9" /LENGTH=195 /DNA_ID=CAMNT_0047897779 /DNA_START=2262 /DNA_END=2852 /DNA_ORIENTATION=-